MAEKKAAPKKATTRKAPAKPRQASAKPRKTPRASENAKRAFIASLMKCRNVSKACLAAGISRQGAYAWRDRDPDFSNAWNDAWDSHLDAVEEAVFQRGVEGWDEPVFFQGVECGTKRRFSDRNALAILQRYRGYGSAPDSAAAVQPGIAVLPGVGAGISIEQWAEMARQHQIALERHAQAVVDEIERERSDDH